MMTDSFANGVSYQVNPAGSDIADFNPTTDRLDFGEISVHGLILGALPDGTAAPKQAWNYQEGQHLRNQTPDQGLSLHLQPGNKT